MKKILQMLVIFGLFFITVNFSGCIEKGLDLGDPLGLGISAEVYFFGIIFILTLIILLIVGFDNAGTDEKNDCVQNTPQQQSITIEKGLKSDRRCTECGRVIPEDAKICLYCGKKFNSFFNEDIKSDYVKEKQEKKDKNIYNKKTQKFCTECGTKLEKDPKFCIKCGNELRG